MAYAEVKHYRGNNGFFSAEEYRQECMKGQSQSFSGVEAQHPNSWAERAIQTIMYMACCFMVHSSLHWTDWGSDDISLWPFAVKHAVWLYNCIPNCLSGLTLLELPTKSKADHRDLLRLHVWGCPAIVLDTQNFKMIKSYPSGIGVLVLDSFWGTLMSTRLLWRMCSIYILVMCLHSFLSSLMISLRQWFEMVITIPWWILFAMIHLIGIANFMLKMNLMLMMCWSVNLLHCMMSGLVRLDIVME